MMKNRVPFAKSYWVIPGRFLAGPYPMDPGMENRSAIIESMMDAGIRNIVCLLEPEEMVRAESMLGRYQSEWIRFGSNSGQAFTVGRFPIHDMDTPSFEAMGDILDAIDRSLGEARPVYLHCWGGSGRTGTVAGCWLARHGYVTGIDVLAYIYDLRKYLPNASSLSPETKKQRRMVILWENGE